MTIKMLTLMMVELLLLLSTTSSLAENSQKAPMSNTSNIEKALFAGGCFWKIQYIFSKVPGVIHTTAGYSDGAVKNPSYEQVCTGNTGHAEVVLVEYDKHKTSYQRLLEAFFNNINPTTLNRQGPDIGTNYRSAIFYYTPEQEKQALAYKQKLMDTKRFNSPIVTEIKPAAAFYPAEDYHQDYYAKHGQVCF